MSMLLNRDSSYVFTISAAMFACATVLYHTRVLLVLTRRYSTLIDFIVTTVTENVTPLV